MPADGAPTLFHRRLINLTRLGGGRFHIRGAQRKKKADAGMINLRGQILLRFAGGRETIATQEQPLPPITRVGLRDNYSPAGLFPKAGAEKISLGVLIRPNFRADLLRCCVDTDFIARRPNKKTFGACRQRFSFPEDRQSRYAPSKTVAISFFRRPGLMG